MKIFKNYYKVVLVLLLAVVCFSCDSDNGPDDLFNDDPTSRKNAQTEELYNLLQSSENGWKVTYFTDDSQLGGYSFVFNFTDRKHVTMVSDFSQESLTPKESEYRIIEGSTTKLSFSTKNYIHDLSDSDNYPTGGLRGQGYRGDFEFLYYGQDGEDLLFQSDRYHVKLRFTPANGYNDLDQNLSKLAILSQSVYSKLTINDDKVYDFDFGSKTRFATVDLPGVFDSAISFGIGFKSNSIVISPGIEVDGQTVTQFDYDEANNRFVGRTEGSTSVVITFPNAPSNPSDDYMLLGNEIAAMAFIYPDLYGDPLTASFFELFDPANDNLIENENRFIARIQFSFSGGSVQIAYRISDFDTQNNVAQLSYTGSFAKDDANKKIIIGDNGNFSGDTQYTALLQEINDVLTNSEGLYVEKLDYHIGFTNDLITLTSSADPSFRIVCYAF